MEDWNHALHAPKYFFPSFFSRASEISMLMGCCTRVIRRANARWACCSRAEESSPWQPSVRWNSLLFVRDPIMKNRVIGLLAMLWHLWMDITRLATDGGSEKRDCEWNYAWNANAARRILSRDFREIRFVYSKTVWEREREREREGGGESDNFFTIIDDTF